MYGLKAAILLLSACIGLSGLKPGTKPNLVIILADDLGYGEPGCYGQSRIKTPHLDRLASRGMRFTQYYAGNTVCAPSRCVLLTGKHTGHADIRDNFEMGGFPDDEERGQLPMRSDEYTLARFLKSKAYRTAVIGKWGLGMPGKEGDPQAAGFDFFYGYACQKQAHNYYPSHLWKNDRWDTLRNGYFSPHQKYPLSGKPLTGDYVAEHYTGPDYAPDLMRREALKFIAEDDRPFFLYYTLPMPHLGIQVPPEELQAYPDFADTPYLGERQYLPHHRPRAAYASMISRLDREVGILMDALAKAGKDQNTLILFLSDNGATPPGTGGADTRFFKSNGLLRGYKMDLYEGGIRVPCIVSWPGKIKPGSVNPSILAAWDWFPTLADLFGLPLKTDEMDGLSFKKALLKNQVMDPDRYLYWEYSSFGGSRAIRKGDWKLIWFSKDNKGQLYNLRNDPGEQTDLSDSNRPMRDELYALMQGARSPARIPAWNKYGQ
ncbi:MAG TPA: arylsulfatase [Saprospiraceae bacterium]|nr:arylsulfatase [Saprospiraceae bacterium]HNT19182.1 arylsulfatase [Saprospiraceae bacterium]